MKRIILAAVALMAVGGMTGAASAQAVKPPMSPELQKIVDGAKAEKVLLSSTNPLVFGGQANLDGAKAWIKENFGVDIDFNVTNGGPFGIIGAKIATVLGLTLALLAIPMVAVAVIDTIQIGPSIGRVVQAAVVVGGLQLGFLLYFVAAGLLEKKGTAAA